MTDNEIKNAIAGCVNSTVKCNECVFIDELYDGSGLCMVVALKYALSLINRQQAEIERLTVNMNAFGLGMKREAERSDNARAEAIKEFAEGLKFNVTGIPWCEYGPVHREIDNLVKEMVGADE